MADQHHGHGGGLAYNQIYLGLRGGVVSITCIIPSLVRYACPFLLSTLRTACAHTRRAKGNS